jgi:predicted permease
MNLFRKFSSLFGKKKLETEMAEEMRHHVELQTELNVKAGMKPDEARYAALRQFGNVAVIQEQAREVRGWVWLEQWLRDLRFSVRSLWRAKGFSLAVLTTLALCIGPNTAILSVLYAMVLKPLPFAEPDRLVRIYTVAEKNRGAKGLMNVPQYLDFKAHADLFEGFSLLKAGNQTMGEASEPFRATGLGVSADFFGLLRIKPLLGRFFTAEEIAQGEDHVIVLTQDCWETAYQGNPEVIGRKVRMNSELHTVIGVAPRSFEDFYTTIQFLTPYTWAPGEEAPAARNLGRAMLFARLKPGVTLVAGLAQLEALERRFLDNEATPQMRALSNEGGMHLGLGPVRDELAEPVKTPLLLLQGGAILVLLIGCVNVVNLLLARANAKRPELAIRHALGAGRSTLLRQMVTESLLLTFVAAMGGIGLAWGALQIINRFLPVIVHAVPPIAMDQTVLVSTLVGAGVIALLVGMIPFALLWRSGLKVGETRAATANGAARTMSDVFVVTQVALALILLVGAGLMIRSFANVMAIAPGFDAARIVQGRIAVPMVRYSDPKNNLGLQQRIVTTMKDIPGVEAVAMVADFGVAQSFNQVAVTFRDVPLATGQSRPVSYFQRVSPAYFEAMGIRVLEGRSFNDDDRASGKSAPAVIVDQAFAERYFPGRSVVGQEITFSQTAPTAGVPWARIIGVVARAQLTGREGRDGFPIIYLPLNQQITNGFTLLLRTARPAAEIVTEMRGKLRLVDPALPLYMTGSLQQAIDDLLMTRRGIMALLGLFAGLALLLAGVGLYGVLAYDVTQRTREIGIRGALGASRAQIVGMILRQGLVKTGLGLVIGVAGALYLTRFLHKLLFDIQPTDPLAFVGVTLLLLIVATLASWLPARRAAKVDPVVALRAE